MSFIDRHLGPRSNDQETMLSALGYDSRVRTSIRPPSTQSAYDADLVRLR